MAYNKAYNPDALPAHAQPDEAAAALSQLELREKQKNRPQPPPQQKPLPRPHQPPQQQYQHPPRDDSYANRRPSPASYHQQPPPPPQQNYRPPLQTSSYNNYDPEYAYPPSDRRYNIHSPPPPAEYGSGPRPQPPPAGWRTPTHQPPRQNLPPPDPDSADLFPLFRAANVSGTGSLTTTELGSALVNADFTPFDPTTIKSLMRMFSTTPPGAPSGPVIVFAEFQNLWKFLAAWRELFERFDEDRSGKISYHEFSRALNEFGYKLSSGFVGLLFSTYNERGERRGEGMSFDLFVQACISLKRMTDVFKGYDDDRDGYVTLSFEEFLSEILKLRES